MTITEILEVENKNIKKTKPIKEKMDKYVPGIDPSMNIPYRNGMIFLLNGSGGSGKTSLLLNMMKDKKMYKKKYDNIFYICAEASFRSVDKHPFKDHPEDKLFHELTVPILEELYKKMVAMREAEEEEVRDEETGEITIVKHPSKYNLMIIDDFADALKQKDIQKQLNKMLIKARHICCGVIFTLQSFLYFPKGLRRQITNIVVFRPSIEEFAMLSKELVNMNDSDALTLFNYCFAKGSYNHLDIDILESKYYRNWNELELKFS